MRRVAILFFVSRPGDSTLPETRPVGDSTCRSRELSRLRLSSPESRGVCNSGDPRGLTNSKNRRRIGQTFSMAFAQPDTALPLATGECSY